MKSYLRILVAAVCALVAPLAMNADEVADLMAQLQALRQQMNALQVRIEKVVSDKEQQKPLVAGSVIPALQPVVTAAAAKPLLAGAPQSSTTKKHGLLERKPGDSLTFVTPNGQITPYGNIDLSFDVITKGISGLVGPDGFGPVGKLGWQPDISSNISYIGVRGFQLLGSLPFRLVYQFESQVDVASMPGTSESNSSQSNVVKGALTSRNSYLGFDSKKWGALKIGKTDAPYKNSTMRMNPFYGMLGDYQVIMGNTGGDNRVEFGTRLDHSIWYESPNWHGFALATLFSPGQNRADNSDNIASGESDCTGGNIPGSGGIVPQTCSDGSFSDAVSTSLTYTKGKLYVAGAYERHQKVNRSSDITGLYASPSAISQLLTLQDTADEDAGKIGAQYIFATKTTVSGIFETLHRYVPSDLTFQNERQRLGTWFALSQQLTKLTNLNFGWAHAFRAPGDPGQHNDSYATPFGGIPGTDATGGLKADNRANMFAFAYKYQATKKLGLYADWAYTRNGPAAHYDLGAGGRTVTTDCHDAFAAAGGLVASDPHCWAGGKPMGASLGLDWKF